MTLTSAMGSRLPGSCKQAGANYWLKRCDNIRRIDAVLNEIGPLFDFSCCFHKAITREPASENEAPPSGPLPPDHRAEQGGRCQEVRED